MVWDSVGPPILWLLATLLTPPQPRSAARAHTPYTSLTHPLHTPYTPLTHPLHTPQARGLRYLFHGAGSANLGSASLLINEAKVP